MNREFKSKENHIVKALAADVRYDGRKKNQFRNITIEKGVIATAEGSARLTCGDTEIIAGVKLSMGKPYDDSPDEGTLMVNCELLPIAHPTIESGPPGIDSIEISRVIDRGLRETHTLDVKSLCIESGESVWSVIVDLVPVNHDGNLIDLGALAAIAALEDAKLPNIVEGKADYKHKGDKDLVVQHKPVPVTVCKIKDQLFIDPTFDEESEMEARLTIGVLEDGNICSLQKGGDKGFSSEELIQAFDMATDAAQELRKNI
ncbi:MAG: exosome complex protein Rrp42 [Nanoarchaeota archaeon]|nr:exosome complex protein Rrp42 [Nanoarchaeota archaeon]